MRRLTFVLLLVAPGFVQAATPEEVTKELQRIIETAAYGTGERFIYAGKDETYWVHRRQLKLVADTVKFEVKAQPSNDQIPYTAQVAFESTLHKTENATCSRSVSAYQINYSPAAAQKVPTMTARFVYLGGTWTIEDITRKNGSASQPEVKHSTLNDIQDPIQDWWEMFNQLRATRPS